MAPIRVDSPHQPGPRGRFVHLVSGKGPVATGARSRLGAEARPHAASFLSVIVPAKNEADGLPRLIDEIARALRPLSQKRKSALSRLQGFEILLIDDGSTDDTRERLRDLSPQYPELQPVFLAESVGQSAAVAAGFHAARGDWIATLDADLQNDPADLVALWNALPGYEAVLGWRAERHDTRSKRIISCWANRVGNWVLGQSIRDTGCSVRIFSKAAALRLPLFDGVHRFFGPLLLRQGCRLTQVPVSHRPRPHGKSHYNLMNRSFKVMIDLAGVAWLMRRPIRFRRLVTAAKWPLVIPDMGASEMKQGRELSPLGGPIRERRIGQEV